MKVGNEALNGGFYIGSVGLGFVHVENALLLSQELRHVFRDAANSRLVFYLTGLIL